MHASARVCEPRLLYHGESLDVSGQFICDSDERRGGDGLSVIWLTEQWWIIPATLSPPRRAANDFIGRAVMTCDGCCFGRRPHFCLLSGCLSAFMSRSVDGALCFSTIRPGCVWTWTQCEISSSSLLLAFASASLMPRRHFGAIFLYFVLTSSVFFRDNFPYLSFPFSYFALHICVGLFVAPCLPPLCHFPLLYLLSSVIFRLFGRLRLPHFVAYLFLPLPPRPLLSFHPSPSPSSFPVFPPPSPLLSPRAPLIISLPRYWSTRPSI